MSRKIEKVSDAIYRTSFIYFVWGSFKALHPNKEFHMAQHIRLLCYRLQRLIDDPGKNLLVTCPPRYGKSFVMSICFIAWLLGKNPALSILVASYGEGLAQEHADLFKKLVETPFYKRVFPGMRIDQKRARSHDIHTTVGGRRKAISKGGEATGFGADWIFADDIIKAADAQSDVERQNAKDYLDNTLYSRLNNKQNGHIVANQQRFHEDDPANYMLEKGFDQICLRAIAEEDECWELDEGDIWIRKRGEPLYPEQESLVTLEKIKQQITPTVFSAQYQQNPVNPGGNKVSWDKLTFYDNQEQPFIREHFIRVVMSWDTASSNEPNSDYSACTVLGQNRDGQWLVLRIDRWRLSYHELRRQSATMIRNMRPDLVLVELASSGYALHSDLQQEFCSDRPSLTGIKFTGCSPTNSKEERFFMHQHWLEQGLIQFPESEHLMPDFRRELIAFPVGKNDDQVDSLIQALEYLDSSRGRAFLSRDLRTGRMPGSPRIRRIATTSRVWW